MTRTRVIAAAAVAAMALTAACGSSGGAGSTSTTAATAPEGSLAVRDPWARATPPTSKVAGIYFEVVNEGDRDALVGVSVGADVAGEAQMHVTGDGDASTSTTAPAPDVHTEHSSDDGSNDSQAQHSGAGTTTSTGPPHGGVTGMTQVMRIDIPAGSTVEFEPGGNHVMLMQLVQPLVAGQTFPVTLQFERGGARSITVEVRDD